ncbi:MAG: TetR/AcrR family transcriptional regulator [Boseongicola sp. SB0662_bin_57]|nr:TetR/AcrR family transcriptional regulator [Boseongicola sp. SB0662_bin_57]
MITKRSQAVNETKAPRRRDAAATAERILRAAQEVFHDKGYEGATTREIADRAGVNLALIKRYYGSKLGLFERAVLPFLTLEAFLDKPVDDLGERLADHYVRTEPMDRFDPILVLLKSISSPDAGPLLVEAVERQAVTPLAEVLGGEDASARAILIATQIAGLILRFRAMRQSPRSEAERQAIRVRLSAYFRELTQDGSIPSEDKRAR